MSVPPSVSESSELVSLSLVASVLVSVYTELVLTVVVVESISPVCGLKYDDTCVYELLAVVLKVPLYELEALNTGESETTPPTNPVPRCVPESIKSAVATPFCTPGPLMLLHGNAHGSLVLSDLHANGPSHRFASDLGCL